MGEQVPTGGETVNSAATVRHLIFDAAGNIFLAQKNKRSRNKGMWEVVGGNIDGLTADVVPTAHTSLEAVGQETAQETGRSIKSVPAPLISFGYEFENEGVRFRRAVYGFVSELAEVTPEMTVGLMPEDNHSRGAWFSPAEVVALVQSGQVARNTLPLLYAANSVGPLLQAVSGEFNTY